MLNHLTLVMNTELDVYVTLMLEYKLFFLEILATIIRNYKTIIYRHEERVPLNCRLGTVSYSSLCISHGYY